MSAQTGLDWLTEGATVAYVVNRLRRSTRVYAARVDKIGKRDVVITTRSGETVRFNINHVEANGDNVWLRKSNGTYEPSVYLAPVDDPRVTEIGEQQVREHAAERVNKAAAAFSASPDTATARQLRDLVDAFLALPHKDRS